MPWRLDCLLNRLSRHRSKKTSKLRATGLCEWNPPVTGKWDEMRRHLKSCTGATGRFSSKRYYSITKQIRLMNLINKSLLQGHIMKYIAVYWGNVDQLLWRHMASLDHNWFMHGFCEKYAACWKIQLFEPLMLRSLLYYCVIQCVAGLTNFQTKLICYQFSGKWKHTSVKLYSNQKIFLDESATLKVYSAKYPFHSRCVNPRVRVRVRSSCFSDMDASWLIHFCIFKITLIDRNVISFNTD